MMQCMRAAKLSPDCSYGKVAICARAQEIAYFQRAVLLYIYVLLFIIFSFFFFFFLLAFCLMRKIKNRVLC